MSGSPHTHGTQDEVRADWDSETEDLEYHSEINGRRSSSELGRQDSGESDPKPKQNKTTFKITSVTLHTEKPSSRDECRTSFGEEDDESAVEDSFVQTDVDENPVPINTLTDAIRKSEKVDSTSRFRVVKIQKRDPYNKGRWRIVDSMPSESEFSNTNTKGEINMVRGTESGNSSRAGSVHYVHGVDDPAKNPINNAQPTLPTIQQSPINNTPIPAATITPNGVNSSLDNNITANPHSLPNGYRSHDLAPDSNDNVGEMQSLAPSKSEISSAGTNSAVTVVPVSQSGQTPAQPTAVSINSSQSSNGEVLPPTQNATQAVIPPDSLPIQTDGDEASRDVETPGTPANLDLGDALEAIVVDNQTEPEENDATAGGVAIDNKIEQAMDLVKSHLMMAVREEVEDLKLEIKKLIERNALLEQENNILKAAASPETIAQLAQLSRQQNHNPTT